ncbi:MMPL family transporter [Streptomyces sp. L7]
MRRAPSSPSPPQPSSSSSDCPSWASSSAPPTTANCPRGAESHVVQQHIRDGFPGQPRRHPRSTRRGTGDTGAVHRVQGQHRPTARGGTGGRTRGAGRLRVLHRAPQGRGGRHHGPAPGRRPAAPRTPLHDQGTGTAAVLVDSKHAIASRLPWAAGLIAVVTLLLVFLLTGSVVIPSRPYCSTRSASPRCSARSSGSSRTATFSGLPGFTSTGSIETTLPVLMFCVAFGLSMDYGVFLLSRIKEEYDRTGDHNEAVRHGLQRTGGP